MQERRLVHVGIALLSLCLPLHAALTVPTVQYAEAEGPDGAVVYFTILVEGGNDGSDGRPADTVTCTPASGSLFPIGTTTVSCVGSEGSTGSFPVVVGDATPPALSLPFDFSVVTPSSTGEVVTYTATATDLVDGALPIACSPASGATFPLGTTTVTCSASDSRGNTASGGFDVTVANTPPPEGNPDITAEATGPDGARVVFNTGDSDDDDGRPGTGGCDPDPGTTFPLGNTVVTCPSGNFTISVVDTTAPAIGVPEIVQAVATSAAGAEVTYAVAASDLVDGSVGATCTPSSGSTFAIGVTTVQCSASDTRGNSSTASFPVEVTEPDVPPTNPDDITVEATGPGGAVVTFDAGTDGGGRPVTCSPASGATFPLGATTVTCDSGATFTVKVVDTTPPVLTLPADITAEATSPAGAVVTFAATADDLVDGSVAVTCTPPPSSTFALGTTTVHCSATDSSGNAVNGSFDVTVVDTTPPDILSLTASPATLWPPNNKLVPVTIAATVSDAADPAPIVRIYLITCDETIRASDAAITGLLTANLRAAREGRGDGRVYTLHLEALDSSGNRSTGTVIVTVPHDQSENAEPSPKTGKRRSAG